MKIKGVYNMPGSKFLWYRWTGSDGKRRAVSLKTDDLGDALVAVKRIQSGEFIARWERGETPQTPATKMVDEYLAMAGQRAKKPMRPKTVKMARYVLMKFLNDKSIASAQDIRYRTIEEWLGGLKKSGKSPDTLNRYGNVLRPFAGYLAGIKLIAAGTFEVPERGAVGRKTWLPMDVVNRVVDKATDPELKFILYAGFHAGLRKSEILGARVFWFDLGAGILHVQNEPDAGFILKDRENRSVPLTGEFKNFLTEYLRGRDPAAYALRPEDSGGKGDYRYDFKRVFASHFKKCGVTCTAHDMRRSFASNLVSRGVSIYKVARWLGDGVAVVEKSYGHLAPADRDIDALSLA
jgi:integrase